MLICRVINIPTNHDENYFPFVLWLYFTIYKELFAFLLNHFFLKLKPSANNFICIIHN